MAKLDDDSLLSMLQAWEDDSARYVRGDLARDREQALRDYNREPYGNEEEGWSHVVTSDIQDTIEAVLPDLIEVFESTDQAVVFDPTSAEDVEGAEQATDACNYVLTKQNNRFLLLYTAIKDALQIKSCAVMWRKHEKRVKRVTPVQNATAEMLALILQQTGGEVEAAEPLPRQPMIDAATGLPAMDAAGLPLFGPEMFNARIAVVQKHKSIKVEAFDPNDLLVYREWTSPLLEDCPYVARMMKVTLSDVHEMGHTGVTAEELQASEDASEEQSSKYRDARRQDLGAASPADVSSDDESQTEGWLRIEFVLADVDGDGIAERRMIVRLQDKILSNDEVSHVQIATASPQLITHNWVGTGFWDLLNDIQRLRTELTRQTLNSGYLANNPRSTVLSDEKGTPYVNIDDLLDNTPGNYVRQTRENALGVVTVPFVGHQMLSVIEHVDQMRESRTGVSMASQGLDPNAINDRTATAARLANGAAQKRVKLMARVFAEILLVPMFKGILKLLTDGDMERIAFRLRNKFVSYDPNEWRDSYDMTVNVGLGTGDRELQGVQLQAIAADQAAIAGSPFGPLLLKPKQVYNTLAKKVENAGFKDVSAFYVDPGDAQLPPPQPPPPDPRIEVERMRQADAAQRFQAETLRDEQKDQRDAAVKLREQQGEMELQRSNDVRDAARAEMDAILRAQQAQQAELNRRFIAEMQAGVQQAIANERNQTTLLIEEMRAQNAAALEALRASHAAQLADQQAQNQPQPPTEPGP